MKTLESIMSADMDDDIRFDISFTGQGKCGIEYGKGGRGTGVPIVLDGHGGWSVPDHSDIGYILFIGKDVFRTITFETPTLRSCTNWTKTFKSLINLESVDFEALKGCEAHSTCDMFGGCVSLKTIDLSGFNFKTPLSMAHMFDNCVCLTDVAWPKAVNFNATTLSNMFHGCAALKEVVWPAAKCDRNYYLSSMFEDCWALERVELPKMTGKNVSMCVDMFRGCHELEYVDLRSFNTASRDINMREMFGNCMRLKSVDLSSFRNVAALDGLSALYNMFKGCYSLQTIKTTAEFQAKLIESLDSEYSACLPEAFQDPNYKGWEIV